MTFCSGRPARKTWKRIRRTSRPKSTVTASRTSGSRSVPGCRRKAWSCGVNSLFSLARWRRPGRQKSLIVQSVSRVALLVLLATRIYGASPDQSDPPGEQAAALARRASREAKAGNNAQAYALYSEAAALQPKSRKYRARMESLQSRAALEAKSAPAALPHPASGEDAEAAKVAAPFPPVLPVEDAFDSITCGSWPARGNFARRPLSTLRPERDFDLNGTARALFDQVASFGLETVYDGDYPAAVRRSASGHRSGISRGAPRPGSRNQLFRGAAVAQIVHGGAGSPRSAPIWNRQWQSRFPCRR